MKLYKSQTKSRFVKEFTARRSLGMKFNAMDWLSKIFGPSTVQMEAEQRAAKNQIRTIRQVMTDDYVPALAAAYDAGQAVIEAIENLKSGAPTIYKNMKSQIGTLESEIEAVIEDDTELSSHISTLGQTIDGMLTQLGLQTIGEWDAKRAVGNRMISFGATADEDQTGEY